MKSNWMQQIQTLIGQKAGAMGGAEGIGKLLAPTALEVYYLSCLVIDVDHFMERGYLDALAQALKIPADVKQGIESDVNEKKRELA
ncbi:TPA: DUF533 domain-containing protein [Serratia marcescens]